MRALKFLLPHAYTAITGAIGYLGWRSGNEAVKVISSVVFGGIVSSWVTLRLTDQPAFLSDPPTSRRDDDSEQKSGKNSSTKIGVLHINLGTPKSRSPSDVGDFLAAFLSDRRVVETPRMIWWCVLNYIILPVRCFTSAVLYSRIMKKKDVSPLLAISRALNNRLAAKLGEGYQVELCMINGTPTIQQALENLKRENIDKVVVFPAFPQYSSTTTASVYDNVFKTLSLYRNIPSLRIVPPYYTHPSFVRAVADLALQTAFLRSPRDHVLFSFHGIPEKYCAKGDPYATHCQATAAAVAEAMKLQQQQWSMSYQSQFGYDKWLGPPTNAHIEELARSGVKRLLVICPGFLVDCLETIDEIGSEAKHIFMQHGGDEYCLVQCLNDSDAGVDAVAAIVSQESIGMAK